MRHQYSVQNVRDIVGALDRAGVDSVEVAHGDGLNGSSVNYGFAQHSDIELIEAAAEVAENIAIATLLLPGRRHHPRPQARGIRRRHATCASRRIPPKRMSRRSTSRRHANSG